MLRSFVPDCGSAAPQYVKALPYRGLLDFFRGCASVFEA
jgi:hypothetical protein